MSKILVECNNCGCGAVGFYIDNEFGEILLSYYAHSFYEKQSLLKTRIKRALKMIWCAITGKEYLFFEICLSPEDAKKVAHAILDELE